MTHFNTPFPHVTRRDLADPPIELILAQVRFPTLAELYESSAYVSFAKVIRSEYPNASPLQEVGIDLAQGTARPLAPIPVWKFADVAAKWTVTLTPEFLALELKRYEQFSEFRDRFDSLWMKLVDVHHIPKRTRLGLRYVDRFASDKPTSNPLPADWFNLIQPTLLSMVQLDPSLTPQAGQMVHSFSIRPNLSLTYRTAFKWGTTEEPRFREAVLDLDSYDPLLADATSIASRLDELKEISHNAFWWTFAKLLNEWDSAHVPD